MIKEGKTVQRVVWHRVLQKDAGGKHAWIY